MMSNITFLEESTWSLMSPSTLLTNLLHSSVASAYGTSTWGPVRDPLYIVVPITVIYVVILLTGLVGNVSTCVVIARNIHMHTASYCYLFSLAVSNLLLLVTGLPQQIYYNWSRYPYVFGEAFCVLQRIAAETSANATALTITAVTVERYRITCHPFQARKLSRAVRLVLVIWMLALGLAVPQALQFGIVYEELPDGQVLTDHTVCAMKRVVIPHSFGISTVVFFVAPITLFSVLYPLIGLKLRREGSRVSRNAEVGGFRRALANRMMYELHKTHIRFVKMLVAVVVAFFICWAPFHVQRLLALYGAGSSDDHTSTVMVTVLLYYFSTTVNPMLYHIMWHPFREGFKETLALVGRCRCFRVLSARHSNTSNLPTGSIVFSFRRHSTVQQDSSGDYEAPGASLSTRPDIYFSMEELTMDRAPCTVQQDSSGDYEFF